MRLRSGGGRLIGDYFYVSTTGGVTIFDVSKPGRPRLVGSLEEPSESTFPFASQEDPDTNGRVFLSDRNGGLQTVGVENVREPRVLGELDLYQHTWTCIDKCRYAYGADGAIVDVRRPQKPKQVGNWQDQTAIGGAHDVTSVRDDLAVVSTTPVTVLDVDNPLRPKVLATGTSKSTGFAHGNLWPRHGRDRFLIMGTENAFTCNADPAFIVTFDTRGWRRTGKLRPVDEYRVPETDPERSSPANTLCGHWFDAHPQFRNGGLITAAWYEDGMRLLRVTQKGRLKEAGYYIRSAGISAAAYWAGNNLIYVMDYENGFDVLRVRR